MTERKEEKMSPPSSPQISKAKGRQEGYTHNYYVRGAMESNFARYTNRLRPITL